MPRATRLPAWIGFLAVGLGAAALALALGRPAPSPERVPTVSGAGSSADPLPAPPVPPPARPRQRGVALGLFAEDVSFSYGPLLSEIAALGATHVALIVPVYQTHGASADLALHTRFSPSLGALAEAIRAARRNRLEVMVFPIVRLSSPRSPKEWRGTLDPADVDAWFQRYTDVVGDLAAVAETAGASRFAVGSELSTLDGDLEHWQRVIDSFRGLFHGSLIYSANWDHYRDARLFDLVDEEGVVAYFRLREDEKAAADVPALEAGWRALRADIETWRTGRDKPFVFTEVGYRSRIGSSAAPWDENPGGHPDLDEQTRSFEAFRRTWSGAHDLDGLYIWNWYGFGGPDTASYTPRHKPAADVVRQLLKEL